MKIVKELASIALLVAFVPGASMAEEFAIDRNHSSINFSVFHQGYSNLHGWFREFTGTLVFDPAAPEKSRVKVDVDISSIDTNQNTRFPSGAASRDETLKGPGFFNVKEFPTMTFESTAVEKTGEKTGVMTGNLTLLGVTKPVSSTSRSTGWRPTLPRRSRTFSPSVSRCAASSIEATGG